MSKETLQLHACPMRCALASACVRSPGFQYSSRKTTVLAALSVIPACNSRTCSQDFCEALRFSKVLLKVSNDTAGLIPPTYHVGSVMAC